MWHTSPLAGSAEAAMKSSEAQKNLDFSWGVKIPMRDGIHLNATVYKPKSGDPTPAIFTLTPYISDSYHARAFYFAQHGYAFVLVDCRGRGNSEGEFEPFINLFGEQAFWIVKFREMYLNHRPFQELDQVVGNVTTHFQKWMQHPTPDAYWDRMALSPEDYDRINIPILTITGHYDGDQPGAMHYYRQHMRSASPAREQHYLIIGPWDHAGTRTPNKEFGGLKFGEAGMLDLNKLHTEWYNWTLKGGPQPEFLKQHVAYYLAGAEEWKYADSLDSISNVTKRLYLNSTNGSANDVFHSGTLEETPPAEAQPDHSIYDPLDMRPADLEREEIKNYITDQRYALNLFGNGLVYHSAPFEADTEITGYLKLVVWIALDVPDTDFQATVYEILRDGSSIALTQDLLRARYRESLRQEKLVTMGEINRYEFDGFTFFSRRIAQGSRLRLLITSPNSIHSQKNYNSGGVVADESGQDARTAHVTLYHAADHLSYLELPLVKAV